MLMVQPTGGGMSLAYQLPAVLIDDPTLVVSPLLALQEDQTSRLEEYGHRTIARRVSSAETTKERDQAPAEAAAGRVEFLLLSSRLYSAPWPPTASAHAPSSLTGPDSVSARSDASSTCWTKPGSTPTGLRWTR